MLSHTGEKFVAAGGSIEMKAVDPRKKKLRRVEVIMSIPSKMLGLASLTGVVAMNDLDPVSYTHLTLPTK